MQRWIFSYILSISVFKEVTNNSSSFMSFGEIFSQGKFCLGRCWDVMGRFVLEHCVCYSLMKTICFCGIVFSIGTRCILCITLIQSQIVNNWWRHEKRNNDKKRRHICNVLKKRMYTVFIHGLVVRSGNVVATLLAEPLSDKTSRYVCQYMLQNLVELFKN